MGTAAGSYSDWACHGTTPGCPDTVATTTVASPAATSRTCASSSSKPTLPGTWQHARRQQAGHTWNPYLPREQRHTQPIPAEYEQTQRNTCPCSTCTWTRSPSTPSKIRKSYERPNQQIWRFCPNNIPSWSNVPVPSDVKPVPVPSDDVKPDDDKSNDDKPDANTAKPDDDKPNANTADDTMVPIDRTSRLQYLQSPRGGRHNQTSYLDIVLFQNPHWNKFMKMI